MAMKTPRLAVRAVIVHAGRVLLVNAWPGNKSELMCAPGGGVEPGSSLPENLAREVFEETGLRISVGMPCLVNEFHDPASGFHQVEIFFQCALSGSSEISDSWQDPEAIVNRYLWADAGELAGLMVKPDSLRDLAFGPSAGARYDPLETIVM